MTEVQAKLAALQEKGWTLAALADDLGVTVNAIEKWKAGDRYPTNVKLVLNALDSLARRKRIPKQRRYSKGREVTMVGNSIVQFQGTDTLDSSMPLPLHVARVWNFPLQYHQIEDKEYFSIKDWIAGLTGSDRASHMWENYRDRHEGDLPPSRGMPYRAPNGQTFTLDFITDEGLYKKIRQFLRAHSSFLCKAGCQGKLCTYKNQRFFPCHHHANQPFPNLCFHSVCI